MLFVSEPWFDVDSIKHISGYTIYFKDRPPSTKKTDNSNKRHKKRKFTSHGGVAIYIRDDIESFEANYISVDDNTEAVWCGVRVNSEKLLIGCIYRPPNTDRCESETINKLIGQASKACDTKRCTVTMICGDFNLPELVWNYDGVSNLRKCFVIANDFLNNINSNYLFQHVIDRNS